METWEMIKKLTENPKLQARGSARGHISMTVAINEFGSLVEVVNGKIPIADSFVTLTHDVLSVYDWELTPQPVPFMEAANSGKLIRHEEWTEFYPLYDALELMGGPANNDNAKKLLNGKWLIKED
jgi:hypothetical protein